MARWQVKSVSVTYAGRSVLAPGEYLEGTDFGGELDFGAEAVSCVGRARAVLVNNGNGSGSFELPVCKDFSSMDDALAHLLTAESWASENVRGTLRMEAPGGVVQEYPAALERLEHKFAPGPKGFRLVLTWCFMRG